MVDSVDGNLYSISASVCVGEDGEERRGRLILYLNEWMIFVFSKFFAALRPSLFGSGYCRRSRGGRLTVV